MDGREENYAAGVDLLSSSLSFIITSEMTTTKPADWQKRTFFKAPPQVSNDCHLPHLDCELRLPRRARLQLRATYQRIAQQVSARRDGGGVGGGLHPSCCEATTESTTTLQHFSATKTQQRVHGCWNKIKRKSGKFLCLLSDKKRWELFWSREPVWLWSEDNTQPSACLEKIKKKHCILPACRTGQVVPVHLYFIQQQVNHTMFSFYMFCLKASRLSRQNVSERVWIRLWDSIIHISLMGFADFAEYNSPSSVASPPRSPLQESSPPVC